MRKRVSALCSRSEANEVGLGDEANGVSLSDAANEVGAGDDENLLD